MGGLLSVCFCALFSECLFILQNWQPSPLYLYFKSICNVVQDSWLRLKLCFHRWFAKMIDLICLIICRVKMMHLKNRYTRDLLIWI
jgi:hypothetical protein